MSAQSIDSISVQKSSPLNNLPFGLTFDDVLLLPGFADFKRQDVDTSVTIAGLTLQVPVISSPMDTVTEEEMAIAIAQSGGLGIIHRNLQPKVQAEMVKKVKASNLLVGAAVGPGKDLEERIILLQKAKVDIIVIDSGHGHTKFIIDSLKYIKKMTKIPVMAGNVATAEGALALVKAGADVIRVGMGPGSICTTRVVTGMGVPQLTAISEAVKGVQMAGQNTSGKTIPVIADGGIKQFGDIAKALASGASAVMLGSMLAGHKQAPGETINFDGKEYRQYRGMGSIGAMQKGGAERYGQDRNAEKNKLIAEGVESLIPSKGDVKDFVYQMHGALRSSFYYIGGKTLEEFQRKAQFIQITQNSLIESHPHSVTVTDGGGTYSL